ncbi:aldolase [Bacillus sp. AFS002410]|uniref:aldolase n=1 Tax=Bacillus sp. AFS002410 TaxID=2033481 RepID=UPI000BF1A7C1|nr:aldolase [Bacillus sp. AFS002410]PEJ58440.1 aldolase [Bacillus sp. AFS002410]
MINIRNKTLYKAFGLSVQSELPLPELTQLGQMEEKADVFIKVEDLSAKWLEMDAPQNKFVVKENFVMFEVPNTAIFSIQSGVEILITPHTGAEEAKIRLYVLGTCMGAILLQRKVLPLHGSAVAINGKAYAIVGNSGAGKSTLASAFLSKGYKLLSDDVIAVTFNEDNKPYVFPAYPQQKLWQESLDEFGLQTENYQPLFERETKYAVPVHSHFYSGSLPLAGVIELVRTESEEIELVRLEKLECLRTLFFHTFRQSFIHRLGLTQWHFLNSTKILNSVNVFQVKRPISKFTVHELVSIILGTVIEEENR